MSVFRGAPIQIGVALYFLWQQLGPSCLSGMVYMVAAALFNCFYVGKKIVDLQVGNNDHNEYYHNAIFYTFERFQD